MGNVKTGALINYKTEDSKGYERKGFVFSTTFSSSYLTGDKDTFHIAYDLDTKEVVSVHEYEVDFHEVLIQNLSVTQLDNLAKIVPVFNALSNRTVAISGKSRTGKDTVGKTIATAAKADFYTSLGDPIKEIDKSIYGTTDRKRRKNLVMIGQSLREKDPHIWIKSLLKRVIDETLTLKKTNKFLEDCVFIVPDVRQPNEFEFFKNLGATTVKVTANETKRREKLVEKDGKDSLDDGLLSDETETHVEGFDTDYTLHNEYDINFKSIQIKDLISSLVREVGL